MENLPTLRFQKFALTLGEFEKHGLEVRACEGARLLKSSKAMDSGRTCSYLYLVQAVVLPPSLVLAVEFSPLCTWYQEKTHTNLPSPPGTALATALPGIGNAVDIPPFLPGILEL